MFTVVGAQAQFILVGEPGSAILYERLFRERYVTRDHPFVRDPQLAPYFVSDIDSTFIDAGLDIWPDRLGFARVYAYATEDASVVQGTATGSVERFRAGVTGRLSRRIAGISTLALDEALSSDPSYTGKTWRGLAGDVETAALSYDGERLDVIFGRARMSVGPVYTNTLASSDAPPLDGVFVRYRAGSRLSASYHLARLDPLSPDRDSGAGEVVTEFVNRWWATHRVDIRPHSSFRLGLFEAIIFAGPGRTLELQYLNPLNFYHGSQLNEDNNDNIYLGFDFDWRLARGAGVYGQLLVDDYQIDNQTRGDNEPSQIGVLAGAQLVDIVDECDARIEFTKVTNRTYGQKLPRNRYLNHGRPIGHPQGTDFEQYDCRVDRWLSSRAYLRARARYLRQGEGRISAVWTEPWLTTENYQESSPTGVVENGLDLSLTFHTALGQGILRRDTPNTAPFGFLSIVAGRRIIDNHAHVPGVNSESWYAGFSLSLFAAVDWAMD